MQFTFHKLTSSVTFADMQLLCCAISFVTLQRQFSKDMHKTLVCWSSDEVVNKLKIKSYVSIKITEILEVNLFTLAYRLFHEDFPPSGEKSS